MHLLVGLLLWIVLEVSLPGITEHLVFPLIVFLIPLFGSVPMGLLIVIVGLLPAYVLGNNNLARQLYEEDRAKAEDTFQRRRK